MFINLTPHEIVLRNKEGADLVIPPSGEVARVTSTPGVLVTETLGVPLFSAPTRGEVEGLPPQRRGVVLIVSALVAGRVSRWDVVSPGTGPNDGAVRVDGRVVAVTRLISSSPYEDDNCPHCGASNGPVGPNGQGVAREGYDCSMCGSH